jgi:UDP-N-acetylglucosamine--N-acetylmuramyl-(pentapeptide) pyrophosphoryl-undecaprenol N-acetylglucosamine transferase
VSARSGRAARRAGGRGEVDVLVTGGGTGGHVYPALAIAEALAATGIDRDRIRFVGSVRGMEATAVPEAGWAIELLPGRGIRRSVAPSAWKDNTGAVMGTLRGVVQARRLVSALRPRVVVGVGGYASVPCVLAARIRRIPVVVHEQNAAPGVANRMAVRLGARAAISLPGTPLRGATLTGNPVRAAVVAVERAPGTPPLVAAVGGSLGSRTINGAVLGLAERWRDRTDVRLRHVTGRRDHAWCRDRVDAARQDGRPWLLEHALVDYEDRMDALYADATIVVARAGAVTVAELAAAGVPSVLVPLPGAPGDHQTRNAEALVQVGAARIVIDAECTPERLDTELAALLADPQALEAMGNAARSLARPDAAAAVARLVVDAMGGAQ